ncbi:MAG TPA: response regulator [Elusimicrobiota bacterium]|nr:response regulator [Elusimicrobiota bacterium]
MTTPAPRTPPSTATGPVLVIEDEKGIARLIRRRLELGGFKVLAAASAEAGLALAREAAPALVVLDIELPAMDGLTLLRLLRRETRVPVILLSGRAGEVDRIIGLRAGADDYISKPFSLDELIARVECLLRRPKPGLKKRRPAER